MSAVSAERLDDALADLATYTDPDHEGWTRVVLTDPYRAERDVVRARMESVGLEVTRDGAGNLVGRLPGLASERGQRLEPLVTGSHTDTVRGGGRFDGIVGVLGALEAVEAMRESGTRLVHDLVVVDFLGEEPNDYGISCVGSRALAGLLTPEHLSRTNPDGETLGAAMTRFGLDPDAALAAGWAPGSMHAYVELHVEQGPLMERAGAQIGVVTAIAGIHRFLARFTGRADHAGATPMDARVDALTAAAQAVLTIEREGCGAPVHGVTTVGRIDASPGSMNVVPAHADVWGEVRSVDEPWLTGVRRRLADEIATGASARGVDSVVEWLTAQDPVPTHPTLQDVIGASAESLGHTWMPVPSGAGHDAAHMGHLGPMGMVFVPSVGGRSHCPQELTTTPDIVRGVDVLVDVLRRLDAQVTVR